MRITALLAPLLLLAACTPQPAKVTLPEQCARDVAAQFVADHPDTSIFWYLREDNPVLSEYLDRTYVSTEEAADLREITGQLEHCYAPLFDDSDKANYFKKPVKRCRDALVGRTALTSVYLKGKLSRGEYLARLYKLQVPFHLCSYVPDALSDTFIEGDDTTGDAELY